jgi:hypothetical protein
MFLGSLHGVDIHDHQITVRIFSAVRYALRGVHFSDRPHRDSSGAVPQFAQPVAITAVHDEIMIEGDLSEAGLELDVLKVAVVNPELFQSLRQVFLNHSNPDSLDDTGKKLYRIYTRLEEQVSGDQTPNP